jgi:hypothetical protein
LRRYIKRKVEIKNSPKPFLFGKTILLLEKEAKCSERKG